jgi:hypothetical protein
MSDDPRRAPGADLPAWVDSLTTELGVDRALVDIDRILDLASDVAHGVARPAVPISAFVAGLAAAGGDPAPILDRVTELATAWGDEAE